MKTISKQVFAIVLSVMMLVAFMPTMTFATNSKLVLNAKVNSASTIKLSWNKLEKATKYQVYGKQNGKSYKKFATLNKNKKSYTAKKYLGKKLITGKKYTFYAVAYKGTKKLSKSKSVTVMLKVKAPKETLTLSYSANGGTGTMSQQIFKSGEKVTVAANSFTAPTGKEFNNWNTAANGTGTSYSPGMSVEFPGNTTLYAQWKDVSTTEGTAGGGGGNSSTSKTKLLSLIADNPDIKVGDEATVIITGKIENSEEESYSIVDRNKQYIGTVYDDGNDVDETEDDGYFTGEITVSSDLKKEEKYYLLIGNSLSQKSVSLYFYNEITDEDNEKYNTFVEGLKSITSAYDDSDESSASAKQLYDGVINYIETNIRNNIVNNYVINENTITITMESDINVIYEFPIYEGTQGNEITKKKTILERSFSTNFLQTSLFADNQVASFEPYSSELKTPVFDEVATMVSNSKYDYAFNDDLDEKEVSIEKMKHLNDYDVVIWNGHGGYSEKLGSLIFSGTKVTSAKNKKYEADISSRRIVTSVSGEYGVSADFFDRYYLEGDFNETFMYLGACHSAEDNIANVLINKGVETILGFKNSVYRSYNEDMVKTIFHELSRDEGSPVTVGQAVATAKKEHGNFDRVTEKPWWSWLPELFGHEIEVEPAAELCIIGNQNHTLERINSSSNTKKYSIKLTWGQDPADMDSHLVGYTPLGNYFHLYYSNKKIYDDEDLVCYLDVDDTSSYGPETVTFIGTNPGTYYYYVHKFSGSGSVNTSQSVAKVYENGVLKHTYYVNENSGTGAYWNVFVLKNGKFIESNTISSSPNTSY